MENVAGGKSMLFKAKITTRCCVADIKAPMKAPICSTRNGAYQQPVLCLVLDQHDTTTQPIIMRLGYLSNGSSLPCIKHDK